LTKKEFKNCFDDLFDSVRNFVFYRCGNEEIATDIAQETFMKLWEKKFEYHPTKTKSLVYKIANQLWISQYRKQASEQKYELLLTYSQETLHEEQSLELKELKNNYEATLANLPISQREVFLMSRMEELSYKEIAQRLNISVKTVEKRMSLTLKELRTKLNYGK
tara:strand:+ start:63 stop:554 length:492 start_codon:yes stop_codon:yes gene_type:complete